MRIGRPGSGHGVLYLIGGLICIVLAVGSFVTFGGRVRPGVDDRPQAGKIDLPRIEIAPRSER